MLVLKSLVKKESLHYEFLGHLYIKIWLFGPNLEPPRRSIHIGLNAVASRSMVV
jgi:hypothetical protein